MTTDPKRSQHLLVKLLRSAQERYPRLEQQGTVEQTRRDLIQSLSEDDPIGATLDAGALVAYRASRGCMRVLGGHADGFAEIDHVCLYEFWEARIRSTAYDRDPDPDDEKRGRSMMLDNIATCWMHAEAIGARSIRTWLDGLIRRADAGYRGVKYKDMSALCTLMAHFVTGKDAATLEAEGWAPLGVYTPIADGTFDASQWGALADWHLENVLHGDYPAFAAYPYCLFPAELMAISRRTGVPLTREHIFLRTPLTIMRDVPEIAVPDELQAVIDCARRVYGEV